MTYAGRCACGAVTATITGPPVAVRQCWCHHCRRIGAGSPAINARFAAANVAITGRLARYHYAAASGNTVTQSFCPQCGTAVSAQTSALPDVQSIRLGFIDEPHDLAPQVAIWTQEAPDWAVIDPKLEPLSTQNANCIDRKPL